MYGTDEIREILDWRGSRQYSRAIRSEDLELMAQLHLSRALSRLEYGDREAMYEIMSFSQLTDEAVKALLRAVADQLQPGDEDFCRAIEVVRRHCASKAGQTN